MNSISGMLITVRTAKQGAAMEKGKFCEEYVREIATLNLCAEDLARLSPGEDGRALLCSNEDAVVVTCREAKGPRGVFFLPLGPVANRLIGAETHGTGVPDYKGIPVTLRPPEEETI